MSLYSLYKLFNLRSIYKDISIDRLLLSNVYDNLKTGDLILFRSTLTSPIADMFMTNFVYKHVGLIVKIRNILYITEINNDKNVFYKNNDNVVLMPSGISIVPLLTRLKYYAGLIYLSTLYVQLNPEKEKNLIDKILSLKEYITYPSIICLFQNFVLNISLPNSVMHCYSYMYYLLKFLDIAKDDLYTGFDLANFITKIDETNCYSKIKNLLYDIQ